MNSLEDFFQLRTSELQFETLHGKQDEFPFHFGYQTDIFFMLSVDQRLFSSLLRFVPSRLSKDDSGRLKPRINSLRNLNKIHIQNVYPIRTVLEVTWNFSTVPNSPIFISHELTDFFYKKMNKTFNHWSRDSGKQFKWVFKILYLTILNHVNFRILKSTFAYKILYRLTLKFQK